MSLITRLEKLEKRAASMETPFDMAAAEQDARKALAAFKREPRRTLAEQVADLKASTARNTKESEYGEDWLSRELATISAEIDRRRLAMLAADLDLLEPLLIDPDGTEAHG